MPFDSAGTSGMTSPGLETVLISCRFTVWTTLDTCCLGKIGVADLITASSSLDLPNLPLCFKQVVGDITDFAIISPVEFMLMASFSLP